MSCLVLSHLMNRIMNGIQILSFGIFSNTEFVFTSPGFCHHTLLQVGFRIPYDISQKFGKFGGVFSFFECISFKCFCNLRIAFTIRLATHGKIHADFRAFSHEMCIEIFFYLRIYVLCDANDMFGSISNGIVFYFFEF